MERGTGEGEKVITTFSFQCSSLYIKNMSGEEKIDLFRGQYLSAVLCFHLTMIQKLCRSCILSRYEGKNRILAEKYKSPLLRQQKIDIKLLNDI